jgi:hypothetical protein
MLQNLKINIGLYIIVFLFCFGSIQSETSNLIWGEEEGSLDWKSAIEKCKSTGMRMPTKGELLSLYKTKEFKKWNANWYWTGEESDKERAWAVVLNVGVILHIPKSYHNNVRCVGL